ncbi:MAG: hypothetical protein HC915_15105 [Anaerolineae bacterium]|nr:hypothetical protein [Anaerolineae bacterium]
MDERYFVISDISVLVEEMNQQAAITFNGTAEWALDYLIVADAVWVPSEAQLRALLEQRLMLAGGAQPLIMLSTTSDGYRCSIQWGPEIHHFDAFGAGEAYAAALLAVLQRPAPGK